MSMSELTRQTINRLTVAASEVQKKVGYSESDYKHGIEMLEDATPKYKFGRDPIPVRINIEVKQTRDDSLALFILAHYVANTKINIYIHSSNNARLSHITDKLTEYCLQSCTLCPRPDIVTIHLGCDAASGYVHKHCYKNKIIFTNNPDTSKLEEYLKGKAYYFTEIDKIPKKSSGDTEKQTQGESDTKDAIMSQHKSEAKSEVKSELSLSPSTSDNSSEKDKLKLTFLPVHSAYTQFQKRLGVVDGEIHKRLNAFRNLQKEAQDAQNEHDVTADPTQRLYAIEQYHKRLDKIANSMHWNYSWI